MKTNGVSVTKTRKISAVRLQAQRPENGMTIGQLASACGVNVETVRYYHREKLLAMPQRTLGSIRRYGEAELSCLLFIKRAQALGFSLGEIALLLNLSEGNHCAETRRLAERKLRVIEQKLADLLTIESALKKLVASCRRGKRGCGCPIIDDLVGGNSLMS